MNEVERESMTALQLAASEGKLTDVQWLVEMGENVDEVDYLGRTALALATMKYHCFVALFLITVGADVNIADFNNFTPLHHVSSYSLTLCESMVAHGAMISQRGGSLELTALHIAAHSKKLEIVRFLLKKGADFTMETTKRDRPIDMTDDDVITKTIHKAEMIRKKINRNQHSERFLLYGGLNENTMPSSSQSSLLVQVPSPIITFKPIVTVWYYDPMMEPNCSLIATEAINLKKRKWHETFSADNK